MSKLFTMVKGGVDLSKFHSGVPKEIIKKVIDGGGKRIHFVGAMGIGMRPLMRLSKELCHLVSGSDIAGGEEHTRLLEEGYQITLAHTAECAEGADLLVYSLAVDEDNPEIKYAERNGIPAVSRAEYLGALMESYKVRIGVSGSHGKSTTSAILDRIFTEADLFPTTVIGAKLGDTSSPVRVGKKGYLIYEACEYKDSFLCFSPTYSLFTNLELEHVDYFENLEAIKDSFLEAINMAKVSFINIDDENLASLLPCVSTKCVTFGEGERAEYRGELSLGDGGKYRLKIQHGGTLVLDVQLGIPGRYNAKNALAAAAAALYLGLPPSKIKRAIESFSGIERRLELLCERDGAKIYYDYAHHPTEIKNAIETVKSMTRGRVSVIFKPHTYSRTQAFLDEFATSLSLADRVYLCEVSAIREKNSCGVSSDTICEMIGERATYVKNEKNIAEIIDSENFSAIIIMGAANLDCVKSALSN